jgi:2-C-methyl-D-erythritol 4-phosphate cytidylyltransferase/2-C-methyl-D-erythritol 2,4-cyclodiphosphate synthase
VSRTAIADAVVVAAGSSQRMGGQDKLDAPIAGLPLLRWAVRAVSAAPEVANVVVVTSAERATELRDSGWLAPVRARVVAGGRRRQDSVAAGIAATDAEIVLVHDAARPFASPGLISRVVEGARQHGAAIPVLPVVDALKHVDGDRITGTAEREGLFRAQTPQGARRDLLAAAAAAHAGGPEVIADEAELLARAGVPVHVVAGEAANIKVTLPADLAMARLLAGSRADVRLALGSDSHPFGPDEGLRLGGLLVEGAPRLHGHSDGDVVLHALCDGLLAASGRGDLGRLFPSGEATTRGIDSRALVAEVMARLQEADLMVDSVDVTISGARPRLGGRRLDAMAASITELTGAAPGRVSVKAASGNLSGDDGAGRTVSATCLVGIVAR